MVQEQKLNKMLSAGLIALRQNKNNEALQIFEKILEIDPTNSMAWNNKGVALRKLKKIEEAIECFNKALSIEPKLIRAMINKARALKMQKKFDLALFVYEDILEIEPKNEEALEESNRVRTILTRQAKATQEEQAELKEEERKLFIERREELKEFLDDSKNNIRDSVKRIAGIYESGIKEEAIEHRNRILNAIIEFNEQLQERLKQIAGDFIFLDFAEENRDLLDDWIAFKEEMLFQLKKLE